MHPFGCRFPWMTIMEDARAALLAKAGENPDSLSDDLLTGANEIAEFLGWSRRRVYYAAEKGYLPIKSVGRLLISRKSALIKAVSLGEAA